jgi:PAS domain S-box-containing protein
MNTTAEIERELQPLADLALQLGPECSQVAEQLRQVQSALSSRLQSLIGQYVEQIEQLEQQLYKQPQRRQQHEFEAALSETMEALRTSEQQLRRLVEKYRTLIETTGTGFAIVDGSGRLIEANAEYLRLTGRKTLDEIIGRRPGEWTSLEDQRRMKDLTAQIMVERRIQNLELMFVTPEGNQNPVELNATVVETDEGVLIIGLCRDIRIRRQAATALAESEARFRQLVENIDEAFWLVGEGRVLYVSPAYEKIWGVPASEFYTAPWRWLESVHPQDRERVHQSVVEKQVHGEHDIEYRIVREDGAVRWVRDRAFPIRNEAGAVTRIAGLAEDITRHKQQQEATRMMIECSRVTGHAFYTTLVSTLAELLSVSHILLCKVEPPVTKGEYRISLWGDRVWGEPFMLNLDELPFALTVASGLVVCSSGAQQRFVGDWLLAHFEADGALGAPLRSATGEVIGLLLALDKQPITSDGNPVALLEILAARAANELERERAEEQTLQFNAELERRVVERTHALAGANTALREVEARQRALLEAVPDMVFRINDQGTFLDFSTPAHRATLVPRDHIIGANIRDLPMPAAVIEESLAANARAIATGIMQTIEYSISTPTGAEYFESRIVRSGEREVVSIVRDITSRVQAAEALRSSEEKFAKLFYTTPLIMLITRLSDGAYVDVNDECLNFLGRPRDEVVGRSAHGLGVWPEPSDRDYFMRLLREYGSVRNQEIMLLPRPDEPRDMLVSATRILLDGEECIIWAAADISERKRKDDALRQSEQRLRQIIDLVPHLIFAKDIHGRFVLANQATANLVGSTPEEMVRHPDAAFSATNEEIAHFQADDLEVLETGAVKIIPEEPITDYRGQVHILRTVKIPFTFSGTTTPAVLGVSTDITELKAYEMERNAAQAEIVKLNEKLEERVRQRTNELEAANRELESFSYSVSHDLRAPLRAINGFSQALYEDYAHLFDHEGLNYLERVRAASQRMARLIDDLLTLSRVTRQEMRRAPVNLSLIANTIIKELTTAQPERQVKANITPDLWADADANLIQVALDNLFHNAWKYTSKHAAAQIEFGSFQQADETVFFVQDDGAGFDMAYADKLFGAFQRLHRDHEFEGEGVGLATVQRIIRRHGGRVWAEGVVEQGATFYFTLCS